MRVVTGKRTEQMDAAAFGRLAAAHELVLIDLGCGDGSFPYRVARARPEALAVGVDPNAEAMAQRAQQARRKPARGGAANAVFVVGALESLPAELAGTASVVTVNFPWSSLLRAVVEGDPALTGALRHLARADCLVQLLVNADAEIDGAPDLSPGALEAALAGPLEAADFAIVRAGWLPAGARVPSRWGGRLVAGSGRRVSLLRAARGRPSALALALLDEATGVSGAP